MRKFAMADITIYTTPACPYCNMAKGLLNKKGARFAEIDVSRDSTKREAMVQRANGRRTVPQIFIGAVHIGGCDDLHALDSTGKLDGMLVAG
jgi:glutaredoxin 3